MPIFIRTHSGDNYRVKGKTIKLRWRLARWFGCMIHAEEEPTANDLWIAPDWIAHIVYISQESLDAAIKAQEDRQKELDARRGVPPDQQGKIVVPNMMIPRKRSN